MAASRSSAPPRPPGGGIHGRQARVGHPDVEGELPRARCHVQALVGEALEAVVPEMVTADLATLEQQAQQVGRVLLGRLIERVAAGHAQLLPRPACCAHCGGQLKRRECPRRLVGDYTLQRT